MRHDGRQANELRPIRVERHFTKSAAGSVLISAGRTTLLCTASVEESLPPWKMNKPNPTGWVTAEYGMLPGSTQPRKRRDKDGRGTEIQRLIGRSLRAAVNMAALGPRTIVIDCDVLEADGGTRTLGITGGFLALVDAVATLEGVDPTAVLPRSVAAVSVGLTRSGAVLDLDYVEDSTAIVDLNVVTSGQAGLIEVQGTAERDPFPRSQFDQLLDLAMAGTQQLTHLQQSALGEQWQSGWGSAESV